MDLEGGSGCIGMGYIGCGSDGVGYIELEGNWKEQNLMEEVEKLLME